MSDDSTQGAITVSMSVVSRLRQLAVIAGDPHADLGVVVATLCRLAEHQVVVAPRQSNLVDHARRELELLGEDAETVDGVERIVRAFADMGHSGAAAAAVISYLERLLRFQNLTELTNDPADWIHHTSETWGEPGGVWQNRRNGEAFSNDGGITYTLLSEREAVGNDLAAAPLHRSAEHRKDTDDRSE